jgi:hypothetical protein
VNLIDRIQAVIDGEQFNYADWRETAIAHLTEAKAKLLTEIDVVEEMRARAFRVRLDTNMAIFEIEQIAINDSTRRRGLPDGDEGATEMGLAPKEAANG